MLTRAITRLAGAGQLGQAGYRLLDGRNVYDVSGDNQPIPVAAIIAGIVNRLASTGATADVLPAVSTLLAALPELERGDSFTFMIRMALAHANTLTLGSGWVANGTVNLIASNGREYLATLKSDNKLTTVQAATTTNANAVLTNLSEAAVKLIGIGMAATGTGIGASALVIATNPTAGTVTLSVNSTATASNIAVTFTPQMELFSFGTAAI